MKKTDSTEFKSYSSLVFMLAVLALPGSARTSPISVAITGTVRIVDDSNNILGGSVVSGDTVTGVYTYDSATPDSNSIPEAGDYWHTSAPFGISLTVNGLTFRTDPDNVSFLVEIVNDYAPGTPPTDNYVLHSYNNIFAVSAPAGMFGGTSMDLISWQLDDPTATALSSP